MLTVTLYARPGCHLCEQAHEILRTALRGRAEQVMEVNIEADAGLEARYGERIPVVAVAGEDVLEWPFTVQQARDVLERLPPG